MPEALKRPRTICGLSAALLLAIAAVYIAMIAAPPRDARAQGAAPPLTGIECEALLILSGLDAERLAIAGATSLEAAVVAQDGIDAVSEHLADLRSAFTTVGSARQLVDDLERKITSGKDEEGDVAALATAKSALASAESARDTLLNTVFTASVATLGDTPKQTLAALRGDPVVELPQAYRLAQYGESDAVVLRDALAQQRIAAQAGEALDQANQAVLSTAENIGAVDTALSNLASLGEGVANAWAGAMDAIDEE